MAVVALTACGSSNPPPPPAGAALTPAPSLSPTPTPRPPVTTFGDGTYLVGTDILPGTYHTAGPVTPQVGCYWERDKDATGAVGSVITNNFGKGPVVVTVLPTDGVFRTNGCQTWVITHGK